MDDHNFVLKLYRKFKQWPLGAQLFSRIVCFKAPYFNSIHPVFETLEPGHAIVRVKKRRSVTNHIGTVHAIAMANAAELAGGTMMEASLPSSMRWIPKGMTIEYLKKAKTDITAETKLDVIPDRGSQDVHVIVEVKDINGELVSRADITMWVSEKGTSASQKSV
ncbi:hotdog fold domain-containing protein [Pseudobacteriovorax antillogorgiicola]|uniref:Acyl-coenzyme A thioesterase PaaI, contains HGG motif n=1 Tax=Pseudobacteriovorax antillogorgiicola TaxID=1513793 RepID=A0A1Y6CB58_9BACT|nr:hotdog fold domain-containing protein [Pseudobacteriovorax antillogorgiicola]TCS49050.1 acyl-coenzyme A thioesterase PaaI-like protein [Pseudobacteriovorax antillogorgiicola]SMF52535.1 Acyl-coenzyme A thioesterase PaaI, contains HGG motif [Pseudobacteriovorax antillogorgiicola]